jgi:hypothetical protein
MLMIVLHGRLLTSLPPSLLSLPLRRHHTGYVNRPSRKWSTTISRLLHPTRAQQIQHTPHHVPQVINLPFHILCSSDNLRRHSLPHLLQRLFQHVTRWLLQSLLHPRLDRSLVDNGTIRFAAAPWRCGSLGRCQLLRRHIPQIRHHHN